MDIQQLPQTCSNARGRLPLTKCLLKVTLHLLGILTAVEFTEWLDSLGHKFRALVDARLDRIVQSNYFGDMKSLGDGLFELRWKNGTRVYYSYLVNAEGRVALMLLGGGKNGQDRDIAKARKIQSREGS